MFRMNGILWAQGCAGTVMFRMNGQEIAPAFPALPPSLAVVCRVGQEVRERRVSAAG